MESQYCHIVIYVYDSQYLHLHLVIIKEGQEFTKKKKINHNVDKQMNNLLKLYK